MPPIASVTVGPSDTRGAQHAGVPRTSAKGAGQSRPPCAARCQRSVALQLVRSVELVLPPLLPREILSNGLLERNAVQVVLERPASRDVTDDQDS